MSDNDAGRWVSVQEAAGLLGKSERTIRRWVDTHKLAHRREGRRIYVNIANYAPLEMTEPSLEELRAQVDKLTAVNELLSIENERLWSTIATLTTHKAIEAPKRRWRWPWQPKEN